MGFWHNRNGQKIIDDANQVALGNWLRQFTAFADAPNTGAAGSVGDWTLAVIDSASCAGSSCNLMLRAQMLSTALAVYFTDPALGGNKINQPVPIGGATISLTNPENVTGAFGGATSMTIMNMLLYQNGVSTANGAQIQQWSRTNGTNQQWQFVDSGGGFFRLRSKNIPRSRPEFVPI